MELFCGIGFLLISIVGALLHFVYDWTSHSKWFSLFVAVNESTWEHLKLAIFPTFIWGIVGILLPINNLAFGVFVSLMSIIIIIPAIFYTYTTFSKKPILAIDISSFFVAIGCAMLFSYLVFKSQLSNVFNIVGIVGCSIVAFCFVVFTILPPKIFLFKDPITNEYGLKGHSDDPANRNIYMPKIKRIKKKQ